MSDLRKIKIIRTVSLDGEIAREGQFFEMSADIALDFVRRGRAVFTDEGGEPPPEGVPPKKRGRPRNTS